ncbi:MAG: glycosyltransferase, partial [Candidatus Saccharibacteria bacterium]
YTLKFDINQIFQVTKMYDAFRSRPETTFALLFESDFYNFSQEKCRIIDESCRFILCMGSQFVRPVGELAYLKNEFFASHANDNWFDFLNNNGSRIVSLPAFVSEHEFSWLPLAERKYLWSIMGARYWARVEGRKLLDENNIKWTGKWLPRVITLLEKAGIKPFTRPVLQNAINYLFFDALESSKYSYTCGSGLGYPIRKFFEIPARGAVLVCLPCSGLEALGFIDSINTITCLPHELIKVNNELNSDPQKAQAIADAGRNLIWEKHTLAARARNVEAALQAIKSGTFSGSYWEKGSFYLVEKAENGQTNNVEIA